MTKTKNERITTLENEVAELKLIVHQIRESKVVDGVSYAEEPSTQIIVEDIIEFEGQQYCKVDRVAREGDVVISSAMTSFLVEKGKPYKVSCFGRDLVLNKETSNIVALYNVGRTPETVNVYELIKPKPLTPNQQRAEIIEKAKEFIESTKKTWSGLVVSGSLKGQLRTVGNVYQVILGQISPFRTRVAACNVEFVINEDKRTIVALMQSIESPKIYARGIAKCDPNDVFNEHIGKAIALGRALGLDVSEFEQAVQPTEFVSGQIITFESDLAGEDKGAKLKIMSIEDNTLWLDDGFEGYDLCDEDWKPKILNDTNAIY